MPASRTDRQSGEPPSQDQRNCFQLDRDRLLYSTAFRRLAGVTQVVSPTEGEVFHSRLTHTLKVSQIARRLAEKFLSEDEKNGSSRAAEWGGIDPDVVESAAMAHDLGHPPFGHLAEKELNKLIKETVFRERFNFSSVFHIGPEHKEELEKIEGFEGNAQSFRIICTLGIRRPESTPGLDLTRATLNATLKYPYTHERNSIKYGVYNSEKASFAFAREFFSKADGIRCIEAEIMDWADDITYSVHDVEDFYRANRIPLDGLRTNPAVFEAFSKHVLKRAQSKEFPIPTEDIESFLKDCITKYFQTERPFSGTRSERRLLYEDISNLIAELVRDTRLSNFSNGKPAGLEISAETRTTVELLKELIWFYVIKNPTLGAHQRGQRTAIQGLFKVLNEAALQRELYLFPPSFREQAEELAEFHKGKIPAEPRTRLVADTICSFTDQQALRMYQRLTGTSQGSILDPIVS